MVLVDSRTVRSGQFIISFDTPSLNFLLSHVRFRFKIILHGFPMKKNCAIKAEMKLFSQKQLSFDKVKKLKALFDQCEISVK